MMLAEELQEASGIPWSSIGISGSVMAGLFTLQSDIDPLVYGSQNCRKAYAALQTLLKNKTSRFQALHASRVAGAVRFPFERHHHDFRRLRAGRNPKSLPRQIRRNGLFCALRERLERSRRAVWRCLLRERGLRQNSRHCRRRLAKHCSRPALTSWKTSKCLRDPNLSHIAEVASFRGRFCEQAKPGEAMNGPGQS